MEDITPVVTVWDKPKGLPIAITVSPGKRSEEVPREIKGSFSLAWSFSTATSKSESAPITRAAKVLLSASEKVIFVARVITCALVTTYPSASMMTPDPRDLRERCTGLASKKSRKKSSEKGSKLIKGFELTIASVEILTTAGETFCTALTTGVIRGFSAGDCRGKKQHMRKAKAYSKNKGSLRLFHLTVSIG
jgi:hypothetical protein